MGTIFPWGFRVHSPEFIQGNSNRCIETADRGPAWVGYLWGQKAQTKCRLIAFLHYGMLRIFLLLHLLLWCFISWGTFVTRPSYGFYLFLPMASLPFLPCFHRTTTFYVHGVLVFPINFFVFRNYTLQGTHRSRFWILLNHTKYRS